jgi:hypothetical protein
MSWTRSRKRPLDLIELGLALDGEQGGRRAAAARHFKRRPYNRDQSSSEVFSRRKGTCAHLETHRQERQAAATAPDLRPACRFVNEVFPQLLVTQGKIQK